MIKKIPLIVSCFLTLVLLSGCAQTQLAAHVVKNTPAPIGTKAQGKSQGYFKVGTPYKIKGKRYYPKETYKFTQTGIASWYGPNFHGKKTANGEIFDMYALTAAHKTLQMPSMVEVTNLENGRSIIVRVNDRGPYSGKRVIDLSKKAADALGFLNQGTAKVRIKVLPRESQIVADMARRRIDTRGTEVAANENRLLAPIPVPEQRLTQVTGAHNIKLAEAAPHNLGEIGSRTYVQAASFSNEVDALSLAQSLSNYGPTRVVPADVMGQRVYRVRMGPLETRSNAEIIITRLEENGVTQQKSISPIVVTD